MILKNQTVFSLSLKNPYHWILRLNSMYLNVWFVARDHGLVAAPCFGPVPWQAHSRCTIATPAIGCICGAASVTVMVRVLAPLVAPLELWFGVLSKQDGQRQSMLKQIVALWCVATPVTTFMKGFIASSQAQGAITQALCMHVDSLESAKSITWFLRIIILQIPGNRSLPRTAQKDGQWWIDGPWALTMLPLR